MHRYAIMAIAIAAGAVLLASAALTATMAAEDEGVAKTVGKSLKHRDYKDGVFKVMAGAGGPTAPLTKFFPQTANIKVGETVTWYNPTRVGEPHTVSFLADPSYFGAIEAPFVIDSANATSLVPNANAEAVLMPGPEGKTVIVGANARVLYPAVIEEDGTVTYSMTNSTFTIDGTQKYVNSGWLWPEGQVPEGLPNVTSFSVKFEEAGDYPYLCIIHPWMTGTVQVS